METDFRKWLDDCGAKVNANLGLFHQFADGTGRGVVALADINADENLIEIPAAAYLAPDTPLSASGGGAEQHNANCAEQWLQKRRSERQPEMSGWLHMVLRVMHELAYVAAAKPGCAVCSRHAYVRTVEPTERTPVHFSAAELALLAGTSTQPPGKVLTSEEKFASDIEPILREAPDLWPPEHCTADLFKRAAATVISRGFHDHAGRGPFLVPVADLFNHSSHHKRRATSLFRDGAAFKMIAERRIKAGEQVFNTYGDLSNSRLLHTYGFVERDNPFDAVNLPFDLVLDACFNDDAQNTDGEHSDDDDEADRQRVRAERRVYCESKGLIPDDMNFWLTKEDMLPDPLLRVLRLLLLDEEEFAEIAEADGELLNEEDDENQVVDVYRTLVTILKKRLQSYPNSIQHDAELLRAARATGDINKMNIATVCISEKQLLLDLKSQLVQEIVETTGSQVEQQQHQQPTRKEGKPSKGHEKKRRRH